MRRKLLAPVAHYSWLSETPGSKLRAELELELMQSQITQRPVLWGEVGARAWRALAEREMAEAHRGQIKSAHLQLGFKERPRSGPGAAHY